jgi:hypothetical protein
MGWNGWVHVLMLLALGVLGASSAIAKKKPEAKEMIDKLAKFSGYIGALAFLWSIYVLIFDVIMGLNLLGMGLFGIITWISVVLTFVAECALGLIFGYGMIMSYTSAKMSGEAKAKSEAVRQKLIGYQIPLGWLSIILGIWWPLYVYVLVRVLFG